jgi:hypothetical protein
MALTKVTYSMIDGAAVNVTDFGAVGNGVANSSTSIQDAIDALPVLGGTVYFPAGTYLANGIVLRDGVHIVGASKNSVIIQQHTETDTSVLFTNYTGSDPFGSRTGDYITDVVFDSVTLKSGVRQYSAPTEYIGNVYLLNPRAVVFRDCNIYMKTVGVQLETSADKRTRDSLCSILFENNEFKYNADVTNTGLDGYGYINTVGGVPGVHVRDCIFEPCRARGMIRLFESTDGTITNGSFNAVLAGNRFIKNYKTLVSA